MQYVISLLRIRGGTVFLRAVASAAPAGKRRLAAVKIEHTGIGLIDEAVGRPEIVLMLFEFEPHKIASARGAAIDVHIPLIALIDPMLTAKLTAADRTLYLNELGVGKGVGFCTVIGEKQMLYGDGGVLIVRAGAN